MKILICVIFLFSLFGCNPNKKIGPVLKKGKAIIEGRVHNINDGPSVIRLAAGGIVEHIEQIAQLDSVGNFRFEIEIFNPQNINLF